MALHGGAGDMVTREKDEMNAQVSILPSATRDALTLIRLLRDVPNA